MTRPVQPEIELPVALGELARLVEGRVEGDPERLVHRIATLEEAGEDDLSFVTNRRYAGQAAGSRAGALLVSPEFRGSSDGGSQAGPDLIVSDQPYVALARIMAALPSREQLSTGVHPTAVVDPHAAVDPGAAVGPYVTVGAGSRIGAGAELWPHVVVGRDCSVGADSRLYPHVVLYDGTEVGERVIVHSGTILGSDGFGFATHAGGHEKLIHRGRVVVEDDVELGANCTVDRAVLAETRIGRGTKVDNAVQIGHNSVVGDSCLLVSHTTLAGSVKLGDRVVMAGQSGVAGHLELGDDVQIAAMSAATRSIPPGQQIAGFPAIEARDWRRQQVLLRRLDEMYKRIKALEKALDAADKRKRNE